MPATILAIDDQEDNLALLEALLGGQGHRVLTAGDGPTGLAIAYAGVDLVLLDLAMPGMDGFAVLTALRADARTRRLPVILLTAYHREAASVARGLALGANEYLTKPIQLDELAVRVNGLLRLSAAEREVERLRRDFASMLVHDLRAPLDGVRMALDMMGGSPARLDLLPLAVEALDEVGTLIDELLQLDRLEDEGFVAHPLKLDLAGLVAAAVAATGPVAAARGLGLRVDASAGTLFALADPGLARRVLDNLLGNALKFTEAGEVVVAVGPGTGGRVRLSVADTGPGIPAEMRPRIFDRYYHVERRRTQGKGGFGLGLAFCERAVAAMHGHIGVETVAGEGSTFWVELPAP